MADIFEKKIWINRQSQYPNRRRLNKTETEDIYTVDRAEGTVSEVGDLYNANNMNGLENRIYSAFDNLESADIALTNLSSLFTANNVDGALSELFTYANSGKSAIAAAIGETKNGTAGASETFASLSSRIKNDKKSFCEKNITLNIDEKAYIGSVWKKHVDVNFEFLPTKVFATGLHTRPEGSSLTQTSLSTLPFHNDLEHGTYDLGIYNITRNGFDIWCTVGRHSSRNFIFWSRILAISAYL